ncbi:hypothetical protein NP493_160g03029 [Ridgeia piscesae]|uniref:Rhodanese domain-containing protein n=1 Tax=Ridgeia piscesae TaxID=27915 RepID=A0AAD9UFM6_RIDPI|nr:hypothetical protein NP493_160g03029 [Ridgeia piscesae]
MSVGRAGSLVSRMWLKNQIGSAKNLRLLDATWTPLKSGHGDYVSKHIPSAVFFDLNKCVKPVPTLARNPPELACFTEYAQSLGINNDSHVVVCDRGGMVAAARTWWTFRAFGHNQVSVLDGGLAKWADEGYDVVTDKDELPTEKGDFTVKFNKAVMRNFEDVVGIIKSKSEQIIDCRKPEHFRGEAQEPTPATQKAFEGVGLPIPSSMKGGHIPGAINLMEDYIVNKDEKVLFSPDEIRKVLEQAGIDLSKPMTTMCYNGHAACLMALAASVLGKEDVAVYYVSLYPSLS